MIRLPDRPKTLCLAALALAPAAALAAASHVPKHAAHVDYSRQVHPILAEKCFACHGLDEKKCQAGLRLDSRAGATGRSASGQPAIVPGRPDASPLIQRITTKSPIQMPPPGSGKKLSAEEISILKKWVAEGAPYAKHWAYVPPMPPRLPPGPAGANPIDLLVRARLRFAGLAPNPPADRYSLIRRVSLDLVGLPPTPDEVKSFVADRSPNAWERLVDRLLASPHFGERWARMWLDLARYADSSGYGSDPLRPNLWPWRDWVIQAFNRNLPYDQFTIEQLAGDLLPNPTREQIIATAFHRNTMTNTEGGTDREEFRTAAVKDRTIVTMQVWMGLTMQCAQCHTHKFDPITNREFYRFMAYFNQTEDNDQPDERPTMPLPTDDQTKRMDSLKAQVAALEARGAEKPEVKAELAKKRKELAAIKPVALPIMKELPPDKRRQTHVLVLANFLQKGDVVTPGTPAAFPAPPSGAPGNRLGVARWLVSRDNPLTARVAANRLWAQLFGIGLVETEEDFGNQGRLPVDQPLLDYLAVRFRDGDAGLGVHPWDVKALLRLIVTSNTYRQSAMVTPIQLRKDPRNRLMARYTRRRLDAETVRDQALAISGLLSPRIGGPSVFPPQPDGLWQAAFNGERTYPTSTGEDRYRRGLYTFWRRTVPYPSMAVFDAPSREVCTIRRQPTNTPLQALVTLNDPCYLEMAQALGRRIAREGGSTPDSRCRFAIQLATGRPARESQARTLLQLYHRELETYRAKPDEARKLAADPLGPLPAGMDAAEQAAWTVVANVLLNLDGVLTNG